MLEVLKEQHGMRRFRLRGLAQVGVEMTWAATAHNLTRLWSLVRCLGWTGYGGPRP